MKTLKTIIPVFIFLLFSCSKEDDATKPLDIKTLFTGNWSGNVLYDGFTKLYPFDLIINTDNSVKNIDIAFNNEEFLGTYTYTNDSLKINYFNGTKWKLKFSNNYNNCSGTFLGYNGDPGTITMSKN